MSQSVWLVLSTKFDAAPQRFHCRIDDTRNCFAPSRFIPIELPRRTPNKQTKQIPSTMSSSPPPLTMTAEDEEKTKAAAGFSKNMQLPMFLSSKYSCRKGSMPTNGSDAWITHDGLCDTVIYLTQLTLFILFLNVIYRNLPHD